MICRNFHLALTVAVSLFCVGISGAQEFFREAQAPPEMEPVMPPTAEEEDLYNMALGPVRFNIAAGIGIEYNDNITLSEDDEQEDFILRPSLTIDGTWRLTEMNTLHIGVGVSYAKYFDHSEYDSFLISPSSEIALSIRVSEVTITLRDNFSYQQDPFDLPVLSGAANYERFENIASIQADWEINERWKLTVGYDHYNLWVTESEFESLERAVDTFYLRPAMKVSEAVTVGAHASVSYINFKEDIQNDAAGTRLGAFIDAQLTASTTAYVEAGFEGVDFDDNGEIADTGDATTYYVTASIRNELTQAFSHRLALSKSTEVGFGSNFYDLYHAEYEANWKMTPSLNFNPTAFYEYYETSGQLGEEAHRFGVAVGLRYILTPSVTLGLDYRFLYKDSNVEGASYEQNLVLLSLYYNF
jgi:opacity protein-like surface antigen